MSVTKNITANRVKVSYWYHPADVTSTHLVCILTTHVVIQDRNEKDCLMQSSLKYPLFCSVLCSPAHPRHRIVAMHCHFMICDRLNTSAHANPFSHFIFHFRSFFFCDWGKQRKEGHKYYRIMIVNLSILVVELELALCRRLGRKHENLRHRRAFSERIGAF